MQASSIRSWVTRTVSTAALSSISTPSAAIFSARLPNTMSLSATALRLTNINTT
jgi:hypothetical protein